MTCICEDLTLFVGQQQLLCACWGNCDSVHLHSEAAAALDTQAPLWNVRCTPGRVCKTFYEHVLDSMLLILKVTESCHPTRVMPFGGSPVGQLMLDRNKWEGLEVFILFLVCLVWYCRKGVYHVRVLVVLVRVFYDFVLFLLTLWILSTLRMMMWICQAPNKTGDNSFADDLQALIFYFVLSILWLCWPAAFWSGFI